VPTVTDKLTVYTQALVDKFTANAVSLGIQDVFYGDQNKVPRSPAVCVEPNDKGRDLVGAPRYTETILSVYVIIYHAVVQDEQVTRKQADLFAEAVEDLIHLDPQLGGLVIHCMVTSSQSGYAVKARSLFRATRMIVEGKVRKTLPLSP
jgi:hypothetical protein